MFTCVFCNTVRVDVGDEVGVNTGNCLPVQVKCIVWSNPVPSLYRNVALLSRWWLFWDIAFH